MDSRIENASNKSIYDPAIKTAIELPKSGKNWSLANTYFYASLSNVGMTGNLNNAVDFMNTMSTIIDLRAQSSEFFICVGCRRRCRRVLGF